MTRILAIADEVDDALYGDKLYRLRPDLIVSSGDLPFEYLENLLTRASVPLVYVPGNHDPDLRPPREPGAPLMAPPLPGPQGCDTVDGRVINEAGLTVAGLGGCLRYNDGPNQYTEREMRLRSLRLEARVRLKRFWRRRGLDILVTHAAPLDCGDQQDPPHRGFAAFHRLVSTLAPRLLIHGHIHPHGRHQVNRRLGGTVVVNAVPCRVLEL